MMLRLETSIPSSLPDTSNGRCPIYVRLTLHSARRDNRLAGDADEHERTAGRAAWIGRATGLFRLEQIGKRWMFITPEGHPCAALGANHAGQFFNDAKQTAATLARFQGDRTKAEDTISQAIADLNLNAGGRSKPM